MPLRVPPRADAPPRATTGGGASTAAIVAAAVCQHLWGDLGRQAPTRPCAVGAGTLPAPGLDEQAPPEPPGSEEPRLPGIGAPGSRPNDA